MRRHPQRGMSSLSFSYVLATALTLVVLCATWFKSQQYRHEATLIDEHAYALSLSARDFYTLEALRTGCVSATPPSSEELAMPPSDWGHFTVNYEAHHIVVSFTFLDETEEANLASYLSHQRHSEGAYHYDTPFRLTPVDQQHINPSTGCITRATP